MKQAWSLLIGQPGPLRDSLGYLLTSIAQIQKVSQADNLPSALCLSNQQNPDLVLLIADRSSSRVDEALARLRLKWPSARYVVMVDDEHSLHMAQAAGADKTVLTGCQASKLVEVIEQVQKE